jgi:hypothetical protein
MVITGFAIRMVFDYFENDLEDVDGMRIMGVQIFIILQGFLCIIFSVNLLGLHIYLKIQGITTYEFIKRKSRKKKIQKALGRTELVNSNISIPESPKGNESKEI